MAEKLTKADSIMRWLDGDWCVVMWRNPLPYHSYSAAIVRREDFEIDINEALFEVDESCIGDGFSPTEALAQLADKPLIRKET